MLAPGRDLESASMRRLYSARAFGIDSNAHARIPVLTVLRKASEARLSIGVALKTKSATQ